jgi:cytochrome c oxidase subunit III
MASATTTANVETARVFYAGSAPWPDAADFPSRLRRARVGMVIAIIGIVMIFVSYSSAYVVRQGLPTLDPRTGELVHDWLPLPLPNFLLINTLVLLVSTITMELARRQSLRLVAATPNSPSAPNARGDTDTFPWLSMTAILGLAFLAGQWLVWRELAARGFYLATAPSSSFFYLLTGLHAVHLIGGILALLVASAAVLLRVRTDTRAVIADATAWYWHFLAFLWIYLLCLLEFAH